MRPTVIEAGRARVIVNTIRGREISLAIEIDGACFSAMLEPERAGELASDLRRRSQPKD